MVNEYKNWDKETLKQKGIRLKYLIDEAVKLAKKESGPKRDKMDYDIAKAVITLQELRKEYKNR